MIYMKFKNPPPNVLTSMTNAANEVIGWSLKMSSFTRGSMYIGKSKNMKRCLDVDDGHVQIGE
jgi:hypothetical protein